MNRLKRCFSNKEEKDKGLIKGFFRKTLTKQEKRAFLQRAASDKEFVKEFVRELELEKNLEDHTDDEGVENV